MCRFQQCVRVCKMESEEGATEGSSKDDLSVYVSDSADSLNDSMSVTDSEETSSAISESDYSGAIATRQPIRKDLYDRVLKVRPQTNQARQQITAVFFQWTATRISRQQALIMNRSSYGLCTNHFLKVKHLCTLVQTSQF